MPPTPSQKATTERTCSHLLPGSIHEPGQTPSTQEQFWIVLNLQLQCGPPEAKWAPRISASPGQSPEWISSAPWLYKGDRPREVKGFVQSCTNMNGTVAPEGCGELAQGLPAVTTRPPCLFPRLILFCASMIVCVLAHSWTHRTPAQIQQAKPPNPHLIPTSAGGTR